MNEFAEKAILEAERYSTIMATLSRSKKDLFREKIVELVVRECSNVIQSYVDRRIPASEYSQKLKNDFGIK
jgi:hypothetical protein